VRGNTVTRGDGKGGLEIINPNTKKTPENHPPKDQKTKQDTLTYKANEEGAICKMKEKEIFT